MFSLSKENDNSTKCLKTIYLIKQKYITYNVDMYHYLEKKKLSRIHVYTILPFPKQALVFMCLHYKSFENTEGKREIAHNEQFLLFSQCFLPVW